MAKIDLKSNDMAMFMVCEAIGPEMDEWDTKDLKPDEDGLRDIVIKLNGKELNAERFLEGLQRSYIESGKKYAADLLNSEYEEKQEIIKKYSLSQDDIEYMISYRNSKNRK